MSVATIVINESGQLINEAGPKENPRECEYYEHNVDYSIEDPTGTLSITSWRLEGLIPIDIDIDDDGKISGMLRPLTTDQPGINSDMINDDEVLNLDGSNWDKIGRFKDLYFDFTFNIIVEFTVTNTSSTESLDVEQIDGSYITLSPNDSGNGGVTSSQVYIRGVKNHDIDNYIFARKYMDAGYELNYNGVVYSVKNGNDEEFFNNHPGPFSGC